MPEGDVSVQSYNPDTDNTNDKGTTVQDGKQTINVEVAPADKSAEEKAHNEAMIKKAEQGTGNNDASDELFAGKYQSEEEYNKAIIHAFKKKHGDNHEDAFKDLTGDLSGSSNDDDDPQTKTDDDPKTDPEADPKTDPETDPETDPNDSEALNMDEFINEFVENDSLSEEAYGKLEASGVDKNMADTYMMGVRAQRDSLFNIVGGSDNFFEMTTWAAEDGGMSEADINLFNSELNSGDMAKMSRAVNMLKTQHAAAGLKTAPAKKIEATHNAPDNSVQGYTHVDELKADQRNPLYAKSAAFRAQVKEKIRRGKI